MNEMLDDFISFLRGFFVQDHLNHKRGKLDDDDIDI